MRKMGWLLFREPESSYSQKKLRQDKNTNSTSSVVIIVAVDEDISMRQGRIGIS